jgi:hypothetical protein
VSVSSEQQFSAEHTYAPLMNYDVSDEEEETVAQQLVQEKAGFRVWAYLLAICLFYLYFYILHIYFTI